MEIFTLKLSRNLILFLTLSEISSPSLFETSLLIEKLFSRFLTELLDKYFESSSILETDFSSSVVLFLFRSKSKSISFEWLFPFDNLRRVSAIFIVFLHAFCSFNRFYESVGVECSDSDYVVEFGPSLVVAHIWWHFENTAVAFV